MGIFHIDPIKGIRITQQRDKYKSYKTHGDIHQQTIGSQFANQGIIRCNFWR